MAQRNDSYLTGEATTIQNETAAGQNTAVRVGTMLNDMIDSKMNNNRIDPSPTLGTSNTVVPSQSAVKSYVDSLVTGLLDDRGNFDASTVGSPYPTLNGSGTGGAIQVGDIYFVSVAGTIGTTAVIIGASVRALTNTPGQDSTKWDILDAGVGFVAEPASNKSNDPTLGTPSSVLFPTQSAVQQFVSLGYQPLIGWTTENQANRATDLAAFIANAGSSVIYPSVVAVKDYIDAFPASGWGLIGNAGTNPTTNFIGTTDAQDLVLKTNNTEKLKIESGGNIYAKADISVVADSNSVQTRLQVYQPSGFYSASLGQNTSRGGYLQINGTVGFNEAVLLAQNLTATRNYQFPDASGVLALTSNIPAPPNLQTVLNTGHNLEGGRNFQGTGAGAGNFGYNVNALGSNSADSNTGTNVNALGTSAGQNNTGGDVNVFGQSAGINNSAPSLNALGNFAGYSNSGFNVNSLGYNAGNGNSGSEVNIFGYAAGNGNTHDYVNIFGENASADDNNQTVFSSKNGFAATRYARLSYKNITADRKYELPDASGTIALTTDIGAPYKSYVALLAFGSGGVTATVVYNTIGDGSGDGINDIAWSYAPFVGNPRAVMTAGNPFTLNKTIAVPSNYIGGGQAFNLFGTRASATQVNYNVIRPSDNSQSISYTGGIYVEIRVYP